MKYKIILVLATFYVSNAYSWGAMGHQTTGEIAERFLSAKAKQGILDLLGPEKLALTSTWADSVRDDPDYDRFKPYHFISIDSDKSYSALPDTEHDKKDSVTVMKNFPEIIKDPTADRNVKLVALKYLIHVVEDIHQPLHVGSNQDAGGNLCRIEWLPQKTVNLHQVWDDSLIEFDSAQMKSSPLKFNTYVHFAETILKKHPLSDIEIKNIQSADFYKWIEESQHLRAEVYPDEAKNYCHVGSQAPLPLLTDDYKIKGAAIVELRLLYGGLRLAGLLNQIFESEINSQNNLKLTKEQILEKLNLTNF
jgi:hypothetical protein